MRGLVSMVHCGHSTRQRFKYTSKLHVITSRVLFILYLFLNFFPTISYVLRPIVPFPNKHLQNQTSSDFTSKFSTLFVTISSMLSIWRVFLFQRYLQPIAPSIGMVSAISVIVSTSVTYRMSFILRTVPCISISRILLWWLSHLPPSSQG